MFSPAEYYKTFVLSYLQNALDKLRMCQILEGSPPPASLMSRTNAVTSVIFSAMTLEAFCNYCIDQFLASLQDWGTVIADQLKAYYEELPIADKWKELFRHRDKNFIGTITADWNSYKELVSLRNSLVHGTWKTTLTQFKPIEQLGSEDAKRALEIVNRMMMHGTKVFVEFIPDGTYDQKTFEPAFKTVLFGDSVSLAKILEEPFKPAASSVLPFQTEAPKEYIQLFSMQALFPPGIEVAPLFEIQPLFFSASSNDGAATIRVVGYKDLRLNIS